MYVCIQASSIFIVYKFMHILGCFSLALSFPLFSFPGSRLLSRGHAARQRVYYTEKDPSREKKRKETRLKPVFKRAP